MFPPVPTLVTMEMLIPPPAPPLDGATTPGAFPPAVLIVPENQRPPTFARPPNVKPLKLPVTDRLTAPPFPPDPVVEPPVPPWAVSVPVHRIKAPLLATTRAPASPPVPVDPVTLPPELIRLPLEITGPRPAAALTEMAPPAPPPVAPSPPWA